MKISKIQVFKSKRVASVVTLIALTAIASGCGKQAYNESDSNGDGVTTTTTTPTYAYPTTGSGVVTPTAQTVTTNTNGSANYSFHFQARGSAAATQVGGGAMSVATDSTLRITITPGTGLPLAGSGYSVGFNCEMFTVRVGNVTQQAFVKKAGYTDFMLQRGYMGYDPCANAETSWTGDFSGALSPGRRTSLPIQISGAQYDNCRLFNDPYDGGCSMSSVYSTHAVDGFAAVFTN